MEQKKCHKPECKSNACWAITFKGHHVNSGDANTYSCGEHLHGWLAYFATIRGRNFVVKPIGKPRFVLASVKQTKIQQYGLKI